MKKRLVNVAVLVLLLGLASPAQIFITDVEEGSLRVGSPWMDGNLNVPELDVTLDQYAPLGGEMLVLGLLGGAYLIGKKRKDE